MRNGYDIERHPLKHKSRPANISYSLSFAEWEAATGAGLDLWLWDNNHYPNQFKAKVLEWWKLHNLVEAHSQDAGIRK